MKDNEFTRLFKETRMTQKEYAEYFEIPKRTIENWCGEQAKCPDHVLKMMRKILKYEGIIK